MGRNRKRLKQLVKKFLDLSGYSIGYLIVEVLWDLAELAIAGILAIFGLKVLGGDCFSFLDSN